MNIEQVSEGAPVWEKVLRKLRGRVHASCRHASAG